MQGHGVLHDGLEDGWDEVHLPEGEARLEEVVVL